MMNMKRLILNVAALAVACIPVWGMPSDGETVLRSPDGNYAFTFMQENSRLWYTLSYKGQMIVRKSELGVNIENRLFESALGIDNDSCAFWGENLRRESVTTASVDTVWTPLYGENATVRNHYNQLTLKFVKGEGANADPERGYDKRRFYFMDIEVRAYDEGIAFRYHFPEQSNGLFLNITGERTEFAMPAGTEAWYEEWAQGPYSKLKLRDWNGESERPLLMQLPGGFYVALLEAAMVDYARGKFLLTGGNRLQVSLYGGVEVMSPYNTPWRVIMAGERATDIINNKDLVLNLNEPMKIADASFVKPGKAYRCGRLEWSAILKGIRFAEQRGCQYIELDAGWYGPEQYVSSDALREAPNRNFKIREVCDSARAHGLGVWLYVNQRALYNQLDSILPLYRQWGVAGIKFGFVQVGNQMWSEWLHRAVRKCAEYGLMVDIHDEYRPTGYSRTYPNLLTQEGILGNECMPDATHNVVLPFTRYICGPADYTLCYYNNRIRTTRAHQLAMAAVYYSPLQFMFWYDEPQVHDGGGELEFWRAIPTVYDESRALDGVPGEYIVQARRAGNDWFVGVMTNTSGRKVSVDTAGFLQKGKRYEVDIYTDDPSLATKSKVACRRQTVKGGKPLVLNLLPNGGAALHFRLIPSK